MTAVIDAPEGVTIPDTRAGLEELLGDTKKVAQILKDGQFTDLVVAFARSEMQQQLDIEYEVKTQVQQGIRDFIKDQNKDGFLPVDLTPGTMGTSPAALQPMSAEHRGLRRGGLFSPKAMGAVLDKEFGHSAPEYFQLIWKHYNRALNNSQAGQLQRIRNAFSSEVPSDGGFLIPETLRSELLRVSLEQSVVRSRARVIPMETLRVPFPAIDTTSNVSSVYGGVVCYWTEEAGTLTEVSPKFKRIVLDAKKLTAYTEFPQELLADSVSSFEPFVNEIFPEALGFYEDIAFLTGSGVGEPLGCLNTSNPAMITVTAESGQGANTIVWENIVKMFARMLPMSMNRAVWVVSPDTFPELATMALSVGTGGAPVWLANGQAGPPMTILGRPVIISEKTPAGLGTQGDISFVDFGFYLIGDRQTMSVSSSEHFRFNTDELAYKIIERVDGRPWLQSAITPQNNSATLSPFVQLSSTRT